MWIVVELFAKYLDSVSLNSIWWYAVLLELFEEVGNINNDKDTLIYFNIQIKKNPLYFLTQIYIIFCLKKSSCNNNQIVFLCKCLIFTKICTRCIHTMDRFKVKSWRKQDINCSLPVSFKARRVNTPDFLVFWDMSTRSIFESFALLKKSLHSDIKLLNSAAKWRQKPINLPLCYYAWVNYNA